MLVFLSCTLYFVDFCIAMPVQLFVGLTLTNLNWSSENIGELKIFIWPLLSV